MSQTPLVLDFGRAGYALEGGGGPGGFKGAPGSITNHSLLTAAIQAKVDRAVLERLVQANSAGDMFAPLAGNQSFAAPIELQASDLFVSEMARVLQTMLGEQVASSNLTFSSASTDVSVTVSAGTIDNLARIISGGGLVQHRPGTVSGSVITWKLKPSFTPTNIKNAVDTTGGKAFRDNVDGAVDTFQVLLDQAGKSGEVWLKGQGCVPSPLKVVYTLGGLLKYSWEWTGAVWTPTLNTGGSPSGLADTADGSVYYNADVVTFALQSQTAAVITEIELKALELSMGYDFIPRTGGTGVGTGSSISGSNLTGWSRAGTSQKADIACTIGDGDWKTWDDARVANTAFQFFVEFIPGIRGTTRLNQSHAIWAPQVKVVGAAPVDVDGVTCTQLKLRIERASGLRRIYFTPFGG